MGHNSTQPATIINGHPVWPFIRGPKAIQSSIATLKRLQRVLPKFTSIFEHVDSFTVPEPLGVIHSRVQSRPEGRRNRVHYLRSEIDVRRPPPTTGNPDWDWKHVPLGYRSFTLCEIKKVRQSPIWKIRQITHEAKIIGASRFSDNVVPVTFIKVPGRHCDFTDGYYVRWSDCTSAAAKWCRAHADHAVLQGKKIEDGAVGGFRSSHWNVELYGNAKFQA